MKKTSFSYSLIIIMASLGSGVSAANLSPSALQGKVKSITCAGCHGSQGIGLGENNPNLAGQKESYLLKQLKAFKTGDRKDPTMNAMASALSEDDMKNLAAYYASFTSQSTIMISKNKPVSDKAEKKEFPSTVYVSMKKSATVETFPVKASWSGGPNMLYTAITPNGKMVLSTSPSTNTVYLFDSSTGKQLAIIKVGKAPKGVKVTPDGKLAYVSNQGSANISVVDLKTLAVIETIKVKKGPHNVRFTKDGKLAYVTLQGGAGIGVIDTQNRKMIKVIPIAGITGPHNLDLSLDEKTAYIRDFVHHVAVVDLQSGAVKKIITVGNGHGGIDTTPDGRYVVTAAIADNYVAVIDTKTLKLTKVIVGNGSHGVRASKDSQWIYVTLSKQNSIAVINVSTMKIEKKIPTAKFPFWIAVRGNP